MVLAELQRSKEPRREITRVTSIVEVWDTVDGKPRARILLVHNPELGKWELPGGKTPADASYPGIYEVVGYDEVSGELGIDMPINVQTIDLASVPSGQPNRNVFVFEDERNKITSIPILFRYINKDAFDPRLKAEEAGEVDNYWWLDVTELYFGDRPKVASDFVHAFHEGNVTLYTNSDSSFVFYGSPFVSGIRRLHPHDLAKEFQISEITQNGLEQYATYLSTSNLKPLIES
jgi:hypothetical protein